MFKVTETKIRGTLTASEKTKLGALTEDMYANALKTNKLLLMYSSFS